MKIFTLPLEEGNHKHVQYTTNDTIGSYMLFLTNLCIDATVETGRLGRLQNHSCSAPNLKAWQVPTQPRVILS